MTMNGLLAEEMMAAIRAICALSSVVVEALTCQFS